MFHYSYRVVVGFIQHVNKYARSLKVLNILFRSNEGKGLPQNHTTPLNETLAVLF